MEEPVSTTTRARVTDPATSHEAARSVQAPEDKRDRIVWLFEQVRHPTGHSQWSPTDNELLANYLAAFGPASISPSGLRTRRHELVAAGVLRFAGTYGTTPAGRKTQRWMLA
jgi:hypothetical protein